MRRAAKCQVRYAKAERYAKAKALRKNGASRRSLTIRQPISVGAWNECAARCLGRGLGLVWGTDARTSLKCSYSEEAKILCQIEPCFFFESMRRMTRSLLGVSAWGVAGNTIEIQRLN